MSDEIRFVIGLTCIFTASAALYVTLILNRFIREDIFLKDHSLRALGKSALPWIRAGASVLGVLMLVIGTYLIVRYRDA
jgi:hypothetical protein